MAGVDAALLSVVGGGGALTSKQLRRILAVFDARRVVLSELDCGERLLNAVVRVWLRGRHPKEHVVTRARTRLLVLTQTMVMWH